MSCYYPDKSTSDDTPCDSTAEYSACCGSGATCMANGLCLADGLFSRGSCTDQTWKSDACAQQCQECTLYLTHFPSSPLRSTTNHNDLHIDNEDAGAPITLCDRKSSSNSTWTCGSQDCTNSAVTFTIAAADFTPLVAQQANATCNGTASSSSASSSGNSGTGRSFSSGQMAGVGAGVGVPLLLAFLTVLWLLLAEKRKRRALLQQGQAAGWGHAGTGGGADQDARFEAMRQTQRQQPVVELDAARERQELPGYNSKRA
ncbi:hypothetical protein BK809_0006004 [Diplodia seriata]|uniref:Uncharacterized protein n=1 Tax=Diplodia seriata TaxID=420778 RepID=A0A1S8BQ33_9PEZI|nr:hypothetical protein BK809_0006004 [Diplodia seriata]